MFRYFKSWMRLDSVYDVSFLRFIYSWFCCKCDKAFSSKSEQLQVFERPERLVYGGHLHNMNRFAYFVQNSIGADDANQTYLEISFCCFRYYSRCNSCKINWKMASCLFLNYFYLKLSSGHNFHRNILFPFRSTTKAQNELVSSFN